MLRLLGLAVGAALMLRHPGLTVSAAATPKCPESTTQVDTFAVNGTDWLACEDLKVHGGAVVLVPLAGGDAVWFSKG